MVSAGYVVARGEAKRMKYPCGRVPEERAYYDDLKEGVRMRRPPREAYAALSSFPNFQYALMDFGTSFCGLTAGCTALLQCEEGEGAGEGQRNYRCLVCWKVIWPGTRQGLIAEPSHVMSTRHVDRLKI